MCPNVPFPLSFETDMQRGLDCCYCRYVVHIKHIIKYFYDIWIEWKTKVNTFIHYWIVFFLVWCHLYFSTINTISFMIILCVFFHFSTWHGRRNKQCILHTWNCTSDDRVLTWPLINLIFQLASTSAPSVCCTHCSLILLLL